MIRFLQFPSFLLMIFISFFLHCALAQQGEGQTTTESPGLLDQAIQKAQSEEGQKMIQMGKEKLQDPETQEKLKSLFSKEKKKKTNPLLPTQPNQ